MRKEVEPEVVSLDELFDVMEVVSVSPVLEEGEEHSERKFPKHGRHRCSQMDEFYKEFPEEES